VEGSVGADGRWQIAQRVAPGRVISAIDPDARLAYKSVHRRQDGFKAHIAVEPDTGLVTDCELTKASGEQSGDAAVEPGLLADETGPVQVSADSALPGFLDDLRASIKDGSFRPLPVRQRLIPKGHGSGKLRSLGIPTVADRVVQAALKLVLEPISRPTLRRSLMGPAEPAGSRRDRRDTAVRRPRLPLGDGRRYRGVL